MREGLILSTQRQVSRFDDDDWSSAVDPDREDSVDASEDELTAQSKHQDISDSNTEVSSSLKSKDIDGQSLQEDRPSVYPVVADEDKHRAAVDLRDDLHLHIENFSNQFGNRNHLQQCNKQLDHDGLENSLAVKQKGNHLKSNEEDKLIPIDINKQEQLYNSDIRDRPSIYDTSGPNNNLHVHAGVDNDVVPSPLEYTQKSNADASQIKTLNEEFISIQHGRQSNQAIFESEALHEKKGKLLETNLNVNKSELFDSKPQESVIELLYKDRVDVVGCYITNSGDFSDTFHLQGFGIRDLSLSNELISSTTSDILIPTPTESLCATDSITLQNSIDSGFNTLVYNSKDILDVADGEISSEQEDSAIFSSAVLERVVTAASNNTSNTNKIDVELENCQLSSNTVEPISFSSEDIADVKSNGSYDTDQLIKENMYQSKQGNTTPRVSEPSKLGNGSDSKENSLQLKGDGRNDAKEIDKEKQDSPSSSSQQNTSTNGSPKKFIIPSGVEATVREIEGKTNSGARANSYDDYDDIDDDDDVQQLYKMMASVINNEKSEEAPNLLGRVQNDENDIRSTESGNSDEDPKEIHQGKLNVNDQNALTYDEDDGDDDVINIITGKRDDPSESSRKLSDSLSQLSTSLNVEKLPSAPGIEKPASLISSESEGSPVLSASAQKVNGTSPKASPAAGNSVQSEPITGNLGAMNTVSGWERNNDIDFSDLTNDSKDDRDRFVKKTNADKKIEKKDNSKDDENDDDNPSLVLSETSATFGISGIPRTTDSNSKNKDYKEEEEAELSERYFRGLDDSEEDNTEEVGEFTSCRSVESNSNSSVQNKEKKRPLQSKKILKSETVIRCGGIESLDSDRSGDSLVFDPMRSLVENVELENSPPSERNETCLLDGTEKLPADALFYELSDWDDEDGQRLTVYSVEDPAQVSERNEMTTERNEISPRASLQISTSNVQSVEKLEEGKVKPLNTNNIKADDYDVQYQRLAKGKTAKASDVYSKRIEDYVVENESEASQNSQRIRSKHVRSPKSVVINGTENQSMKEFDRNNPHEARYRARQMFISRKGWLIDRDSDQSPSSDRRIENRPVEFRKVTEQPKLSEAKKAEVVSESSRNGRLSDTHVISADKIALNGAKFQQQSKPPTKMVQNASADKFSDTFSPRSEQSRSIRTGEGIGEDFCDNSRINSACGAELENQYNLEGSIEDPSINEDVSHQDSTVYEDIHIRKSTGRWNGFKAGGGNYEFSSFSSPTVYPEVESRQFPRYYLLPFATIIANDDLARKLRMLREKREYVVRRHLSSARTPSRFQFVPLSKVYVPPRYIDYDDEWLGECEEILLTAKSVVEEEREKERKSRTLSDIRARLDELRPEPHSAATTCVKGSNEEKERRKQRSAAVFEENLSLWRRLTAEHKNYTSRLQDYQANERRQASEIRQLKQQIATLESRMAEYRRICDGAMRYPNYDEIY